MKVCLQDHLHSADRLKMATRDGKPCILGTEFDCNDAKPLSAYEGEAYLRAKALIDGIRPDEVVCIMAHDHVRVDPISGCDHIPGDAYHRLYALPAHIYAGEARPKAEAISRRRPR